MTRWAKRAWHPKATLSTPSTLSSQSSHINVAKPAVWAEPSVKPSTPRKALLTLNPKRVDEMKRAELLELERIRKRIAEMEAQLNALRSWEADCIARLANPNGGQTAAEQPSPPQ
jgi:hypothetical protein